ncbi:MAG: sugar ABC transporter substrate-binding protein [Gemmatimonadota bacterium]
MLVTHGQSSDPFWSIVANGASDAARDLGVRVEYQAPSSFDMVRMSNLIDAAVASRPAALIVSIPDADALAASIRAGVSAGIPMLSINAGADAWKRLGLLAHIGQTEYGAGEGAGRKLAEHGARKVLCVNHEVGNGSLDERCRGSSDALKQAGGSASVLAVNLADPDDAQQRVASALASDAAVDGVLTLGPGSAVPALAALRATGRAGRIAFGTFDLDPQLLQAIESGDVLFAIDQQPYLQGYLAVVLMTKYLEARTMAGGGDVIRTGPSFVTRENADAVAQLAEQGIR